MVSLVFLQPHDKDVDNSGAIELLKTDGIKLKTVMCIDDVDFTPTYSNSCIEAARAAIMRELCRVIEF